ncbi:hypothetical protein, partial [Pseudomonas syringae]|uniref:hypothetical protein n=1 Tax=Pseudomonas syringae TaxID=317 RepID=UPI001F18382A
DAKLGTSKQSTSQQVIEETNRASALSAGNDVNLSAYQGPLGELKSSRLKAMQQLRKLSIILVAEFTETVPTTNSYATTM